MKSIIHAAGIVLAITSSGMAAAHAAKAPHRTGARSYNALAPELRAPARTSIAPFADDRGDPNATATGGPAGGLGS